ncbi:MAG: hypothetical protein AAFV19_04515 [Pseudomonadota bacterium]
MANITNRESLKAWLNDRPREDAVLIAARAAVRVAPLLHRVLGKERPERRKTIVLPVFRAMAIARFAGTWPTRATEVRGAANAATAYAAAATAAATNAATAAAANAATNSADAAANATANAADAADAADAVANAYVAANATANAAAWTAVQHEASALERGASHMDVSRTQLWPTGTPEEMEEAWVKLKVGLLTADEQWDVWTKWYDDILAGLTPDEDLELAKCLIPDEVWEAGPATLNAEIARLIKELGSGVRSSPRNSAEAALETAQLRAALTDFSYDQLANLMRSVPFDDDLKSLDDPAEKEQRQDRLKDLARDAEELMEDLEASGSNLPGLANALRRYRDEATKPIELAEHRRLWFNYGAALNRVVLDEYSMSSLQEPVSGNLREFVQRHLDLFRDYLSAIVSRTAVLDEMEIAPEATLEKAADVIDAVLEEIDDPEDGPAADEATRGAFRMDRDQIRGLMDAADRAFEDDRRVKITADVWTRIKMFAVTAFRLKIRAIQSLGLAGTAASKNVKTFADGMKALRENFPAAYQMLMDLFRSLT